MTRFQLLSVSRGFALVSGISVALMLAVPAQADDDDEIQATVEETNQIVEETNQIVRERPTSIVECMTISHPGSYVVVQNLDAVGDCLLVEVDHVTIDLGGFVLRGDRAGVGVRSWPRNVQRSDITVHNGTLTGFVVGIFLEADGFTVRGVRAFDNEVYGIRASGIGIVLGNTAADNGGDGIRAQGTVSGNTAKDNGRSGIAASGTVIGNTVQGNIRDGIEGQGTISGNTVDANGGNGIYAQGTITGNTVSWSRGNGIVALFGSTVSGNTSSYSSDAGLRVQCPSNVIGNTATDNQGLNLIKEGDGCNDVNNLAPGIQTY